MKEENPKLREIVEWIYCIVIAVILAVLIKYFVGTPTVVKMSSMYPTFKQNERLILNRVYRTMNTTPRRGEVITFESPSITYFSLEDADLENPVAIYENEPKNLFSRIWYYVLEFNKTSYIKRVIGLPGEHIQIKDSKVYINGEELEETYLSNDVITNSLDGAFTDIIVPDGTVFVMGDNREHSGDSRRFGCIPFQKIESKVWLRFWPLNRFGVIEN